MNKEKRWIMTIDWCNKDRRGVFCDAHGNAFVQDKEHTADEMAEILGLFWMILNPKSELMTADELQKYTEWYPLEEYSDKYGYAIPKVRLNEIQTI